MSTVVHEGLNQEAIQDFEHNGLSVVSGLVHPGLAEATVGETHGFRFFARPRRLEGANGEIATMHSSADPANTALGAVISYVEKAGHRLDLRLGATSGVQPGVQAVELSEAAREPYVYNIGHTGVAALVNLEGSLRLRVAPRDGLRESVLEPGTVAFLKKRKADSPYYILPDSGQTTTSLFLAGIKIHPAAPPTTQPPEAPQAVAA